MTAASEGACQISFQIPPAPLSISLRQPPAAGDAATARHGHGRLALRTTCFKARRRGRSASSCTRRRSPRRSGNFAAPTRTATTTGIAGRTRCRSRGSDARQVDFSGDVPHVAGHPARRARSLGATSATSWRPRRTSTACGARIRPAPARAAVIVSLRVVVHRRPERALGDRPCPPGGDQLLRRLVRAAHDGRLLRDGHEQLEPRSSRVTTTRRCSIRSRCGR